ncbi:MAG: Putrescine transport system permease protein PotH [Firmicutes bacterium]|nr:Putrescine transport system permease protein PotH [Bacillota bacterium]
MKAASKPYLLAAPLVLFLTLTFGLGLGYEISGLTLRHFLAVLGNRDFVVSLVATLSVAAVATLVSNVGGAALAFAMLKARAGGESVRHILQLPVIMPHLVVTVIVFHIFAQTGVLARLAWWLGFIDDPNQFPLLVFDHFAIGIMLVYLYKQIPFVAMVCFDSLRGISHRFGDVGENLGATPWQVTTRIYLPLLKPTLMATALITFAFAFGAFEVPFLLGTPLWRTLPVEAYLLHINIDPDAQARSMAINVIISAISLGLALVYSSALRVVSHVRHSDGDRP